MKSYHYSIVRCRDAVLHEEHRNVALLVVCPAAGRSWLARGRLDQRAHLLGDDAAFVRALLDVLEEEASELARGKDAAVIHDWMRARARPTEDALSLGPPAMGIAPDVQAEVRRLRTLHLGRSGGGRSPVEQLQVRVLRANQLSTRFSGRAFASGPATWRFPYVADLPDGPLVFSALQFSQTTPEGVLDAAFHTVGRAAEVGRHHPDTRWLTVAACEGHGATARAFGRAVELMGDVGMKVVAADEQAVAAALASAGMIEGHWGREVGRA